MRTVNIKIWKFKELLHDGNYQFETMREAQNYQLGLFNGMNLMGAEATGMELKPVEVESNSLIRQIIERKEAGADCTEAESSELKGFIKSHIEFIDHFGEENSSEETVALIKKVVELFQIEVQEALMECNF